MMEEKNEGKKNISAPDNEELDFIIDEMLCDIFEGEKERQQVYNAEKASSNSNAFIETFFLKNTDRTGISGYMEKAIYDTHKETALAPGQYIFIEEGTIKFGENPIHHFGKGDLISQYTCEILGISGNYLKFSVERNSVIYSGTENTLLQFADKEELDSVSGYTAFKKIMGNIDGEGAALSISPPFLTLIKKLKEHIKLKKH